MADHYDPSISYIIPKYEPPFHGRYNTRCPCTCSTSKQSFWRRHSLTPSAFTVGGRTIIYSWPFFPRAHPNILRWNTWKKDGQIPSPTSRARVVTILASGVYNHNHPSFLSIAARLTNIQLLLHLDYLPPNLRKRFIINYQYPSISCHINDSFSSTICRALVHWLHSKESQAAKEFSSVCMYHILSSSTAVADEWWVIRVVINRIPEIWLLFLFIFDLRN